MKVKLNNKRIGTVVETFDDGVAVLLHRKKEKNYKHHQTEYIIFAKKGTYELQKS